MATGDKQSPIIFLQTFALACDHAVSLKPCVATEAACVHLKASAGLSGHWHGPDRYLMTILGGGPGIRP
jgi:hypothetical protein